jgi:hypothetical protein
VFHRGEIRFIVCDWSYSKEQHEWLREVIKRDNGSSVSIVLHHGHYGKQLRRYFEGLEGKHNVKLVLSGHSHSYHWEERDGITYITGAGIASTKRDCDSMLLSVYRDRLQLYRYVIPKGSSEPTVLGPNSIWTCKGEFGDYGRPFRPTRDHLFVNSQDSGQKVSYNAP